MKQHENILVFSKSAASPVKNRASAMIYNPQFREGEPYKKKSGKGSVNYGNYKQAVTVNNGSRYPTSILDFAPETGLHPTQKPLGLLKYLISTYSHEGGVVLDNCMGSNTTGLACVHLGRSFIGIEKEKGYFNIATKRISELTQQG